MSVKRVFEGLTIVTAGVILLGNTTGALPWSVWLTIVMLWPLLIVSLGIDILGRAVGSDWLRALSSLVIIGGLVYGALVGAGRVAAPLTASAGGQAFELAEPADPAITSGHARVSVGLSTVTLRPGSDLAAATGTSPFGKPTLTVTKTPPSAEVRIASAEGRVVLPGTGRALMDVRLGRDVKWDTVTVDGGLCDLDLDLSDLDVPEMATNVGLSNGRITFGMPRSASPQPYVARISGGLSSFTLRVPAGLGVEVVSNSGLGSVEVPQGWTRTSGTGPFTGTWRSDGYDAATAKLRIEVRTGLTSVRVERY